MMHRNLTFFALFSYIVSARVIQRSNPAEIVYLINCDRLDTGEFSSGMAYYSDFSNSKAGQLPDARTFTDTGKNTMWESGSITGTFPDHTTFTVSGLNFGTSIGSPTGSGKNSDGASFTCFREQITELFMDPNDGNLSCQKIYSCAHSNHIVFTQTRLLLDSNMIPINNAGTVSDILANAVTAYDPDGAACSNKPFSIGDDGCTISFDCTAANTAVFTAMTNLLKATLVSQTQPVHTSIRGSCEGGLGCLRDAPLACCSSRTVQQITFPMSGTVTSNNIDQADPDHPSIQAQMKYSVSCPAPAGCDQPLCDAIVGAAPALNAMPEFAILGAIGQFACLLCH